MERSKERDDLLHRLGVTRHKIRRLVHKTRGNRFLAKGDILDEEVIGFINVITDPVTFQSKGLCIYKGADDDLKRDVLKCFNRIKQLQHQLDGTMKG